MSEETFPLDDAAIEILSELNMQIRACQQSQESVLRYFYKKHQLSGKWQLAPNGRELIKPEEVKGEIDAGRG